MIEQITIADRLLMVDGCQQQEAMLFADIWAMLSSQKENERIAVKKAAPTQLVVLL